MQAFYAAKSHQLQVEASAGAAQATGAVWPQRIWKVHRDEEAHGGVRGVFRVQCVSHNQVAPSCLNQIERLIIAILKIFRQPRPGEEDGKDYHYVTRETMQGLIDENQFIENAEFRSVEKGARTLIWDI